MNFNATRSTGTWWRDDTPGKTSSAPAVNGTYTGGFLGWSGAIYTALMTNLTPGVKYRYTVGKSDGTIRSASKAFVQPALPSADASTLIAVTADMGTMLPLGWCVAAEF